MRSMTWFAAALVLGAALVAAPPDSLAQTAPAAQPAPPPQPAQPAREEKPASFSAEQLEQLVAPIALYPDSLLTQTLMASTYPLEIVEAARWLQKNPSLKDSALTEALKGQDWDPSVKSICGFPEVLKQMDTNLNWMQDLGDAFLAQQAGLMDAIQRMRAKAYASGNLKSTEQQKVTQSSESVVIIEPANPEVIYVPTYSPTVVYGGWGYPSYYYPTMYLPPPPGIGFMTFTAGVAFGAAVWGHADWGHHSVDVDVNRYNNFNRNTSVDVDRSVNRTGSADRTQWQHNPEHRQGVNYKDSSTAKKYGGTGGSNQVTRDQARGRAESRPQGGASAGTRDVPHQVSGSSGSSAPRPSSSDRSYSKSGGSNSGAYSGSRNPSSSTSAASSRGSSSRGTSSYSGSKSSGGSRPSGGGGSRPSGGGGGGGRGGGGGGRR
jgi:hypothetical protein